MYDKVVYSIQVVWQGEVGIGAKVNSVDAKVKAVNTKVKLVNKGLGQQLQR